MGTTRESVGLHRDDLQPQDPGPVHIFCGQAPLGAFFLFLGCLATPRRSNRDICVCACTFKATSGYLWPKPVLSGCLVSLGKVGQTKTTVKDAVCHLVPSVSSESHGAQDSGAPAFGKPGLGACCPSVWLTDTKTSHHAVLPKVRLPGLRYRRHRYLVSLGRPSSLPLTHTPASLGQSCGSQELSLSA